MKKIISDIMLLISCFVLLSACGGSSATTTTTSTNGLGESTSLTGTVFAPNGTDPVAGATVYIPASGSASLVKNNNPTGKTVTGADGTTCDDPPETACAQTCSGVNGSFTMTNGTCSSSATTIKMVKGSLVKSTTLDCSGTTCTLAAGDTTFGSSATATNEIPTMAVVTGSWDDIEDVLAKLGFGTVGSDGHLDKSKTFQFTLFDGDMSLDDSSYQNFDKLLDGTVAMSTYDIIFINCGNDYESQLSDSNVISRISSYVSGGGKLYVTDLSYDFIEQVFANFLRYQDDPLSGLTAGTLGAAEDGKSGVTVNAVVNDTTMKNWLKTVTVIQHDSSTPGNPELVSAGGDCRKYETDQTYTTRTGALTSSDTIPIDDFLSGWAQIYSTHSDGLSPTLWISSGSGVTFDGLDNRPLAASVDYGSHGGKIAYTSYHTAHSCPTQYFWPQERVMQYLILETF